MAEICEEYKERIEEEIEEPLKKKVKDKRKKCKKKKCKKLCLCCNKWFCWIETFFYWVVRWIVTIVVKWFVYIVCRIVSVLVTLFLTGLNLLSWPVKWLACIVLGRKDIGKLPLRNLQVEVIIVDKDKQTLNRVDPNEIDDRIAHADRILQEEARISVKKRGKTKRMVSSSLYHIDASGIGAKISEYLKGIFLLLGRNSARHLTVYCVGNIEGVEGLHLPLYGSVFIEPGTADTTLAHELGHATLALWNTYELDRKGYLMNPSPNEREGAPANWPAGVPKLTRNERCTMRRSRWLDYSWTIVTA